MKASIEYSQQYIAPYDITVIFKTIRDNGDLVSLELSGFYYGEPSVECLDMFKENGTKYHV